MAQVPYNPVPNVDPSGAIPRVGLNTPEAAFGGNVAGAVQHLGGTMESVGNELFSRAMEMKKLQIETEVNDGATKYNTEGPMALEEYQLNKGNKAAPALDGFIQQHNDLRNSIRAGLGSDYARKMFDRETLTTNRYLTVHAAAHAKTETNSAYIGSMEAKEASEERKIEQTPLDNQNWDTTLRGLEPSARAIGDARGWDEDQIQNYMGNRRSKMIMLRAQGLARTDPGKAKDFVEQNKHNMLSQDYNRALGSVNSPYRDTAARSASSNVNAFPEGPGMPAWLSPNEAHLLQGVQEPLSRVIRQMSIDNPDLKFNVTSGFRSVQHNKDVGGAPASQHLVGGALDFVPKGDFGVAAQAFEDTAEKLGIPVRTIVEKDHVHVMLPKGTDLSKIAPPIPEPPASRVGRAVEHTSDSNVPGQDSVTEARTMGEYHMQQAMIQGQRRQDRQSIGNYIAQNKVTDPSVLEHDPKIADIWSRIQPADQVGFIRKILHLDNAPSDPRVLKQVYTAWRGNENDPDSVNKFLDMQLEKIEGLSRRDMEYFQKKQADIMAKPTETDPRFNHALGLFQYEDVIKDFWHKQNDERWTNFAGTLGPILDQYYHDHRKGMPDTEILETGHRILRDTVSRFLGSEFLADPIGYMRGTEKPGEHPALVNMRPAAAEIDKIKQDAKDAGKDWSDEQALRAWRTLKYQQFFGGAKK